MAHQAGAESTATAIATYNRNQPYFVKQVRRRRAKLLKKLKALVEKKKAREKREHDEEEKRRKEEAAKHTIGGRLTSGFRAVGNGFYAVGDGVRKTVDEFGRRSGMNYRLNVGGLLTMLVVL